MKFVPWAILLLAAVFAGFTGYKVLKPIIPVRPTLSAHPDFGSARINEDLQAPLAINFELLLNSNTGTGQYEFHTDEPTLVKSIRRENE